MKVSHCAAVLATAEQWRAMLSGMKGGPREDYDRDLAQRKNGWLKGVSVCLRDIDQGRLAVDVMMAAWARNVTRSESRQQHPCYGAGFRKAIMSCIDDLRKAAEL